MADQTATTSQGDAGQAAQGAPSQQQGDAQGATQHGADTVDGLRSRIAELERDNYSYREEKRKREEADKAKTDSQKSESERLTARVTELERQLTDRDRRAQEQSLRLASITEAQRMGYRNPDVAYRLIDLSKVDYDKDGNPTNVGALLDELAKSDEYLLITTDFGGGQRGQSASRQSDMNALIRKAAGRS